MQNACENCKYWDVSDKYEVGHNLGMGICSAAPMFWDCTEWDKNGERRFTKEHQNTKAFVQDGSDYRASLLTRPEFSCVSFDPKG